MTVLLLAACVLCLVVFVLGAATACDDLAYWQWRVYGVVAAMGAGLGLRFIHAYGRAQGYW